MKFPFKILFIIFKRCYVLRKILRNDSRVSRQEFGTGSVQVACGCSENPEVGVTQLKGCSGWCALLKSELWFSQRDFIHVQQTKVDS